MNVGYVRTMYITSQIHLIVGMSPFGPSLALFFFLINQANMARQGTSRMHSNLWGSRVQKKPEIDVHRGLTLHRNTKLVL
jgi:hypothetical protein